MKNKHDFINSLANDLKPVHRLTPASLRLLVWAFLIGISVVGIMLFIQPFRSDFLSQLGANRFTLESLSLFVSAFLCAYLALHASEPGRKKPTTLAWLMIAGLVTYALSLAYGYLGHPSLAPSMAGKRPSCFYEVLALSWPGIVLLTYLMRQGLFMTNSRLLSYVALAGAIIPAALMQVACMYIPEHILLSHILPVALIYGIILSIGRFFITNR